MKTLDEAIEETREALERVESATDPKWAEDAILILREINENRPDYHCDDVWAYGLEKTGNDRALGPIMRKTAKWGWAEKTNYTRPSLNSHLSGKPVWRSLIYKGGT